MLKSIEVLKHRILASPFLILFLVGTITSTAAAITPDSYRPDPTNSAHKQTDPGATTKEHTFNYPAGTQPVVSQTKADAYEYLKRTLY